MLELLLNLDKAIVIFLNGINFKILDYLMIIVSFLGSLGAIWLFFCLLSLIFDKKNGKKVALLVVISLLFMVFLHFTIDSLYFRARPYTIIENIRFLYKLPINNSFPSGHVASAFIGVLIFSKFYKKFKFSLYVFAILTAISRVYLAVHYPSDVIFGAIEGIFISKSIILIGERLIKLK